MTKEVVLTFYQREIITLETFEFEVVPVASHVLNIYEMHIMLTCSMAAYVHIS